MVRGVRQRLRCPTGPCSSAFFTFSDSIAFAPAEVGEEVVARLDTALAKELHEGILAPTPGGREADEVVLVMEEGHPEDSGDDPDRGGREDDGEPEGKQEVHASLSSSAPCFPSRASTSSGCGGSHVLVEEEGLPSGSVSMKYAGPVVDSSAAGSG